jgi:hypothetical protein
MRKDALTWLGRTKKWLLSIERGRTRHCSVATHLTGACATRQRPRRTHVHACALRTLATIERVAAIPRAYCRKCAGHRFLDAAASNQFAFNDYAFKLLGERILPTHLSAAHLLPGLVRSACACFGCGPIALDDDDRAAVLGCRLVAVIGRGWLRKRCRRCDREQRPPFQMPAYH